MTAASAPSGVVQLRLATGPVSWGVDFADRPDNPPWRDVVDGVASAGYRWMELGPLGYLPLEADALLRARGIGLTAGFVFEPLSEAERLEEIARRAGAVARRVAGAGGRFLVIIDAVAGERAGTAGQEAAAPRLSGRPRAALERALARVADIARRQGLRPLVHPHAGTHLEFEDEWEPMLEHADLCLDTGHLAYAGSDPVAIYRRWAPRVPYLHLKDVDPARCGPDFWRAVATGAFTPLGAGSVDLAGLLCALEERGFDGWGVVEQDRAPGGDPVGDLIASRRALEAIA